ncbi:MAG: hypothetical protein LV481_16620 [Methylacidiphilales bacterium]|nr:hypothetical protein [Candidatus Methylacidiphilales bacterium]
MSPEQLHRRNEFILGIDAGLAASHLDPTVKLDLNLARSYVKDWNAADWTDLKAELRNQLTVWVEKYLYNLQEYPSQSIQRKAGIMEYSLALLKDIKKVVTENDVKR